MLLARLSCCLLCLVLVEAEQDRHQRRKTRMEVGRRQLRRERQNSSGEEEIRNRELSPPHLLKLSCKQSRSESPEVLSPVICKTSKRLLLQNASVRH